MVTVAPANDEFTNIVNRAMKIKNACNIPFSEALKVLEISENEKAHERQTAILESIRDSLTAADSAAELPRDQSETEQPRKGRPRKEE